MDDAKRDVDPGCLTKPYVVASRNGVSLALTSDGLMIIVSSGSVTVNVPYSDISEMVDVACQYLSQHNIKR